MNTPAMAAVLTSILPTKDLDAQVATLTCALSALPEFLT
jgi:hypothetical protein